ncbi:hypothetical protein IC229_07540 [Spirosoma sp. BT702]|uniref:Uncharacterized protein n=1 Tax=Spirosoma profusum TaxID=2771354 RepID=A0A927ATK7_9BACT|nr:hypothetical protein [Spirosoma profusum]MBD2700482.1 hypothetical protein [Spirosoma profusum]
MKTAFYFGLLLCLIGTANLILWIGLSTKDLSFEQTKALYLSYFPVFFRNVTLITLLGIAFGCFSAYLLIRSQGLTDIGYRRVGQLFIGLNTLLIMWQAFSLM